MVGMVVIGVLLLDIVVYVVTSILTLVAAGGEDLPLVILQTPANRQRQPMNTRRKGPSIIRAVGRPVSKSIYKGRDGDSTPTLHKHLQSPEVVIIIFPAGALEQEDRMITCDGVPGRCS